MPHLRIGDVVPDFTAPATMIGTVNWHEYINGHWAILFSHPADYTPVCTTELGTVSKLMPEFEKRGVKVAGLSVDPLDKHEGWIKDINETQHTEVKYPIFADQDRNIAVKFGMLDQTELDKISGLPLTVRSLFIMDPVKKFVLLFHIHQLVVEILTKFFEWLTLCNSRIEIRLLLLQIGTKEMM